MMNGTQLFLEARDRLLTLREDLEAAHEQFRWPELAHFNWALDYFDVIAAGNHRPALRVVDDCGKDESLSYQELSRRSSRLANFLRDRGVAAGDRILLMLGNCEPLWETMLAAIKLRAVIVPATTLLDGDELGDRFARGRVKAIVTHARLTGRFRGLDSGALRLSVGSSVPGWLDYELSRSTDDRFVPGAPTRADELLLLYFTSGTTARPKVVAHTHASYPIGHLSTMYWLGLRPGDAHLNLSSPGWAKHAWSSFFAPWNAETTVVAYQYERFDARALLGQLTRCRVTTFCAPPTVWRLLIQHDLKRWPNSLREACSAGEPLNAEVIECVRDAWGVTIRDGFGQTETTAQVGNPPGQPVKPGSMGRALPGCPVVLVNAQGEPDSEGEICIDLARRPPALMREYLDDAERQDSATRAGYYHTGDVASRDAEGYLTYIGRLDDVFKSSDYRISPFELESVLLEHPAVVESAVVPSPDPVRMAVPKAFIVLAQGCEPNTATAESIFRHVSLRVPPYKRVRRIEFATLPKTISGKIRRVELRDLERDRVPDAPRRPGEFWEADVLPP